MIELVEAEGGDARARLRHLFALASTAGQLLKVDLAVRDWARRDEAVAKRLRRVDNRRMDYLRSLFGDFCSPEEEVEARCLLVGSLWIGSHVHGRRSRVTQPRGGAGAGAEAAVGVNAGRGARTKSYCMR